MGLVKLTFCVFAVSFAFAGAVSAKDRVRDDKKRDGELIQPRNDIAPRPYIQHTGYSKSVFFASKEECEYARRTLSAFTLMELTQPDDASVSPSECKAHPELAQKWVNADSTSGPFELSLKADVYSRNPDREKDKGLSYDAPLKQDQ